ncbi:helix-turn-helix domain-containing protein [Larkinella soli]|uniref:helix-turn-helix domain-containing protein n=1 Tax=Larkinella soli TaxID=1770527 RepID=UPI000FFBE1E4
MNVNDKIKQILKDKNLSPSQFADEIGIQRSSISHILSGRNRPSFDIIQKIIRRFPDLGYDWIMEEDEPVSAGESRSREIQPVVNGKPSRQPEIVEEPFLPAVQPESSVAKKNESKTIERILIFYTDGTFREYAPA